MPTASSAGWLLLVYRVPSEPSRNRVAVWRELKRIGALYLQQCVCVVPRRPDLKLAVAGVRTKIATLGGSSNLFEITRLPAEEEAQLIAGLRDLTAQQYAEIVEECDTKFVKEIEFERFRQNYTFAEAEEISQDLDKIRVWFGRVQEHDWFEAPGRDQVARRIRHCETLLEDFYGEVHRREATHANGPDAAELEHRLGLPPATLRKTAPKKKTRRAPESTARPKRKS